MSMRDIFKWRTNKAIILMAYAKKSINMKKLLFDYNSSPSTKRSLLATLANNNNTVCFQQLSDRLILTFNPINEKNS